ncbi:hypothetical protein [Kaarinaea lacus]
MMSQILFIIMAAFVLMGSHDLHISTGAGNIEPIIACVLTLVLSPWIQRQFD